MTMTTINPYNDPVDYEDDTSSGLTDEWGGWGGWCRDPDCNCNYIIDTDYDLGVEDEQ